MFLRTLFMLLLFRNLLEAMLPEGRIQQIVKASIRILCFIIICSSLIGWIQNQKPDEILSRLYENMETISMPDSYENPWLHEEYEAILIEQAGEWLRSEEMEIEHIELLILSDGTIQKADVHLQLKQLKESLIEIQIQDITCTDPEVSKTKEYEKELSEVWGIHEEVITVHMDA